VLDIEYSGQFKRDLKRIKKRQKNLDKIKDSISLLSNEEPLPESYLDHPLSGKWNGCRDLHIEPDWLLIYRIEGKLIRFERTGTHSDLFN